MDGKNTNYRLKAGAMTVLVVVAAIADLFTLIPFVGDFVGPAYWICVSIFLYMKGFGILNARRFATSAISMVAEMIPVVQEFPLIIVGIIIVIVFSRIEDKTGIKIGGNGVQGRHVPLNQGGVRMPSPGNGPATASLPGERNDIREETKKILNYRGYTEDEAEEAVMTPREHLQHQKNPQNRVDVNNFDR